MGMIDSCYLCEIGKDGILFPMGTQTVLICDKCLLAWLWEHPKFLHHRKVA